MASVVSHMNYGEGEHSYARNSTHQENVIKIVRPMLEDTIKTNLINGNMELEKCFKIADFGCSSGPNTLLVISHIMDTIFENCRETGHDRLLPPDEFQVYLNDLPTSDFNSLFKLLPDFYEKLKKERDLVSCFVSAVPGSFYTKLFPTKSLHFAHSSYALQFFSQVPKGIENNKGNIYIAKSSPPNVFEAYLHQFQIDFSRFLCCRGEEIVSGGPMVLTLIGRSIADPTCKDGTLRWDLLSKSLRDMAAEGRIQEADIDSFNLPIYTPCHEEVITIVEKEGSFSINKTETFEVNWDPTDQDYQALVVASEEKKRCGENVARVIRAVFEPMLAVQFGKSVIDDLFASFANYVADYMSVEKTKQFNIVISLTKLK